MIPQEEKPAETNLIGVTGGFTSNILTAEATVPNGKKILIKTETEDQWKEVEMTDEDFNQLFPNLMPDTNQPIPEPKMSQDEISQTWGQENMINDMSIVNPMEVEGLAQSPEGPVSQEPDLLQMIVDDTVRPEDPTFQDFVSVEVNAEDLNTLDLGELCGPSTSKTQFEVRVKQEDEQPPVKRGRGRPRLPRNIEQVEAPR